MNTKPPPVTPKPKFNPGKTTESSKKLTTAQLTELVEHQASRIDELLIASRKRDSVVFNMEKRIAQLEYEQTRSHSLSVVKDRVAELLAQRITQLEQYTRRYSVIVKGIDKNREEKFPDLKEQIKTLIGECDSTTTFDDVDKFHRNGPREGKKQDIIIRFKSHTAKENFYKKRKSIPRVSEKVVNVQPSLSSETKILLAEAKEMIVTYQSVEHPNPPHFVLADMHGNLLVKMTHETRDGLFLKFGSLDQLRSLLYWHNSFPDSAEEYEKIMFDIANPNYRSATLAEITSAIQAMDFVATGSRSAAVS